MCYNIHIPDSSAIPMLLQNSDYSFTTIFHFKESKKYTFMLTEIPSSKQINS